MTLSSSYIMFVHRTLFVTVCVCHTDLIKATCLLISNPIPQ